MKYIYVIPGYGVPKDMSVDFNYQIYLRQIFNAIFDQTIKNHASGVTIIFTGGHTDTWPPYRRSEAGEMAKAFKKLMTRPIVRKYTRTWQVKLEDRSISTLENHLFVRKITGRKPNSIIWFTELTRSRRSKQLGRKVFGHNFKIAGIDFDVSANRYRLTMIDDREKLTQALDLWALKSPANFRAHHKYFVERHKFLRRFPPTQIVDAVHQWRVMMAVKKLPPAFRVVAKRRGLI